MNATSDLTAEYVTKRAKFKKRAEGNLNKKVLDGLRQLQRCANRKIYAYDEQQIDTLVSQIELALAEMKKAYATNDGDTKNRWIEL